MVRRLELGTGLAAVAVRLLPVLFGPGLTGSGEYDDTVHFAAAAHLIAGDLPYRDFAFLQPPGVLILLTPFAWVARLLGDGAGLGAARLAWMVIAGLNAALIVRTLTPRGATAAAAGGLIYALWRPVVASEHTLLLEPLLTLGLLASMLTAARRPGWSGAALGAAAVVKIWAVPLAVVPLWLAVRDGGVRAAGRWLAGAVSVGVMLIAPFVAAAPTAFIHDVLTAQAGRAPAGDDWWNRMQYLSGFAESATIRDALSVHGLALLAGLAVVSISAAAWTRGGRPWVAVAGIAFAEVLLAPSFGYHYMAFPAAPVCVLAGLAVTRLRVRRTVAAGGAALLAVSLAVPSLLHVPGSANPMPLLSGCVFAPSAGDLLALHVLTQQLRRGCSSAVVDPYGEALLEQSGSATASNSAITAAVHLPKWQNRVRLQMTAASAAALPDAHAREGWDAETDRMFDRLFRPTLHLGSYQIYARR